MKIHVKENALILKYSADKLQLLTSDNKVFAFKNNVADRFRIAVPNDSKAWLMDDDPTDPTDPTDPQPGPQRIKLRVCIGFDYEGKCLGWEWQYVWE